jgi:hypothetical protein
MDALTVFAEHGWFPIASEQLSGWGWDRIEFWLWSNRDIDGVVAAVRETDMAVTASWQSRWPQ